MSLQLCRIKWIYLGVEYLPKNAEMLQAFYYMKLVKRVMLGGRGWRSVCDTECPRRWWSPFGERGFMGGGLLSLWDQWPMDEWRANARGSVEAQNKLCARRRHDGLESISRRLMRGAWSGLRLLCVLANEYALVGVASSCDGCGLAQLHSCVLCHLGNSHPADG